MDNTIKNFQNILWVDYAKFFGIFLMIFGHIISIDSHIYNFIYLFHMPLFFILSGYLYKKRSKKENFTKILWGLLIPYYIYQFLYLPLRISDLVLCHNTPFLETLIKTLYGIFFVSNNNTSFFITNCSPCWFIICIVILKSTFNFLRIKPLNLLIVSIFAILISKILIQDKIWILFCIDCAILALPYFALGVYIKEKKVKISLINNKYFLSIIIITGIILLELILHYNLSIKTNKVLSFMNNEYISLILKYIAGIVGSFLVIFISSLFKTKINFIDKISKNTLFIIFFHEFILFFLRQMKIPISINSVDCLYLKVFLIFLLSAFILYTCYLTISILEKKFPIILGKYLPQKS